MKLVCSPSQDQLDATDDGTLGVLLFGHPKSAGIASAGGAIAPIVARQKLLPEARAWDLLSIALAVVAADTAIVRADSENGWTRLIDLTVSVRDIEFWSSQVPLIQQILCFLTTDVWTLSFAPGGYRYQLKHQEVSPPCDAVALLSGGLDSLIGAIDLCAYGQKPFLTSQVAQGDRRKQIEFAQAIGGGMPHLQLNHNVRVPGATDDNQRARSVVFLAYGVLAATAIRPYREGDEVDLFVCENGFISINPPLTDLRIGSLSTRTTHPTYLGLFQQLLDNSGIRVKIKNPYRFATKGHMLRECADQLTLGSLASRTTSCGRFGRTYQHCGRCLPCLIRRAAFLEWGQPDSTSYIYGDLGQRDSDHANFDDVRAAKMAIDSVEEVGIERWAGAQLSSPFIDDPKPYLDLLELGVCELSVLLQANNVV